MKIGSVLLLLVVMSPGCKKKEEPKKDLANMLSGLKIKGDDGTEVTLTKDGLVAKGKDGEKVVMGKDGLVAHGKDGTVTMTADKAGDGMVIKGPKGEVMKITGDSKTGTITGAHGAVSFGTGTAAKDFPLPVFAGAKVAMSAYDEKKKVYTLTAQTTVPSAEVADFYEAALKKKGISVKRTNAGPMVRLDGKGDGVSVGIMCMRAAGKQPGMVTIIWKKEG